MKTQQQLAEKVIPQKIKVSNLYSTFAIHDPELAQKITNTGNRILKEIERC